VNQDDYIKKTEYWAEGSPWKIEEGKNESVLVKEGYKSEIAKFKLEDTTGMDLTEDYQCSKSYFNFHVLSAKCFSEVIKQLEAKVKTQGTPAVYGVSTLPNTFKTIKNMMMDATAIKTIARSNPLFWFLKTEKLWTNSLQKII
jgi:hypothetical protein